MLPVEIYLCVLGKLESSLKHPISVEICSWRGTGALKL